MRQKDIVLLALFACRNEGYYLLPEHQQTAFFASMGGVCLIALLWLARPVWWPLATWIAAQETMNAACSFAWMLQPGRAWAAEQCSALAGVNIGLFGMLVLLVILAGALDRLKARRGSRSGMR